MWQLKAGFEDITEQYTKQGIMLYLQTKDTGANLLLKLILDDIPEPLILLRNQFKLMQLMHFKQWYQITGTKIALG